MAFYSGWLPSTYISSYNENINETDFQIILNAIRSLNSEVRKYWYNQYTFLFQQIRNLEYNRRNLAAVDYEFSKFKLTEQFSEYNIQLLNILSVDKTNITVEKIANFWSSH